VRKEKTILGKDLNTRRNTNLVQLRAEAKSRLLNSSENSLDPDSNVSVDSELQDEKEFSPKHLNRAGRQININD
jgi:hypothetical protein